MWDDEAVCAQISRDANAMIGGSSDSCLIIDPSGFPKKGRCSVGVARQYCGNTGKIDNCQVGVFATLARGRDACLINKRLYLPKSWCEDPVRCDKAGIPDEQREYKNRGQLALELIEDADLHGVSYSWIGMDTEFGKPWILDKLVETQRRFVIDVASNFSVHKSNPRWSYRPKRLKPNKLRLKTKPVKVDSFIKKHGKRRWRSIEIRDSTRGLMRAEYLHKKIWFQHGDSPPRLCHLLIRRSKKEDGKTYAYKYSLSNAPMRTSTQRLAYQQAQRFWVEQSIKDGKDGLGMDEYQIRKWNGWQHHITLTLLAALYVLKTRLSQREVRPLLSVNDVKEVLAYVLPLKVKSIQDVMAAIDYRHEQRWASYEWGKRRYDKSGTTATRAASG